MEAYRLVSFTSTNTGQLQPSTLATACTFILTYFAVNILQPKELVLHFQRLHLT